MELENQERLLRLTSISNPSKVCSLTWSIGDYQDVEIMDDSVLYCFDKETEILTSNGWKYIKDIDIENDMVFSREPNTARLDWVKADGYINYHYKGKMFSYEGKEVSLLVTPNHRIFCSVSHSRKKVISDVFVPANEFYHKYARFISAGGHWKGNGIREIEINSQKFDLYNFAYLLGVFVTDGCVNSQYITTISQKKPYVIEKIERVLKELEIVYSKYHIKRGGVYTFVISSRYRSFFSQFRHKDLRRIPKFIKDADVDILERLIEGMVDGDSDYERRKVINASKSLRDDLMEICFKIGLSSSFKIAKNHTSYLKKEDRYITSKKECYITSIKHKKTFQHIYENDRFVDYDDMVYCVRLEKWHTVLVRRNGKCVWCGQCDIPYAQTNKYVGEGENFDYERFYEWCLKQKEPLYICSYEMPEKDFKVVAEFARVDTMSATNNGKLVSEKVFMPRTQETRGNIQLSLF